MNRRHTDRRPNAPGVRIVIGGFAFALLGVVLTVLKLAGVAGVADLSWWLVLLPFYLGPALVAALAGLAMLAGVAGAGVWLGLLALGKR